MNNHVNKSHCKKNAEHDSAEDVLFSSENSLTNRIVKMNPTPEVIPLNDEENKDEAGNDGRNREKTRCNEINQERVGNLKWREMFHEENSVYFSELKETKENEEECKAAKLKELKKFEDCNVFEGVKEEGQYVLGTRFVLTEKSNGSIKARFVIKGFQEENHQADSPTASRDTLKVFCSITAKKRWPISGSDVEAAFL